ncbi:MAG: methionyl-tRNA synthetase [Actinomycetota bacterium]|nr:methionyl-tRNA synthetase [Actinomycetota bacterium]
MSDEVFYITTPIFYVNDVPHLGHAYNAVAADVIARFRRLQGRKVHFLTGTDEHGEKILRTAQAKGLSPKDWTDQIVPRWKEVWAALDISYDDFIRTTEERHEGPVGDFVQALYDRDEIYLGTYEGLYCVGCEGFKAEDELVNGHCPLHPTLEIDHLKEDNYFFRLSKYADRLVELWESEPDRVLPEARRNEVLGKVKQGLDDLSISRVSFDWGVPLPWDSKHVIYVWVDALQNYTTAVGYGRDQEMFDRIWPADIHLIGKDILWFHTVIWHAMLMALDLPLPKTVYAHGFLQVGGEKMSKSTLTGISPHDLIGTFGSDGYRYYFTRDISFGQDGEFSWEGMVARYNADLANDFGNLVSRVTSMMNRYLDGVTPEGPTEDELTDVEMRLRKAQHDALTHMEHAIDQVSPHLMSRAVWSFVRKSNAYVEEVAPWALAKDPDQARRLEVVLYTLTDALRLMALMVSPLIPRAARDLWNRLGQEGDVSTKIFPDEGSWGLLAPGTKIELGDPLFPRLEEEKAS